MCIQHYREYTCGCQLATEFEQCRLRHGTNVKCEGSGLRQQTDSKSFHMCSKHLVAPGKDEMSRKFNRSTSHAHDSRGFKDNRNAQVKFDLRKTYDTSDKREEERDSRRYSYYTSTRTVQYPDLYRPSR
ncbi:hypothetical protein K461DRAFT_271589 [Myriangium duriaei CBS 260.36]|uniref:Uncharacterized protein n=1 Tax=Myriangium duriaei CBS 260.36 TaxID=1168546 RepID=A0A9P4IWB4_9PEZI|nr:hypothetical protein K461DRAFT_271589 [Myriangium duriaei CBS 260.36]